MIYAKATIKERPILFSDHMVQATLDNLKTRTRRIIKPQPGPEWEGHKFKCEMFSPVKVDRYGYEYPGPEVFGFSLPDGSQGWKCPYGQPGGRLWVRETFYAWGHWEQCFSPGGEKRKWKFIDETNHCNKKYMYQEAPPEIKKHRTGSGWYKRLSLFMPRAASRLLLEITDVRVEQLRDVSEGDSIKEGWVWVVEFKNTAIKAVYL